MSMTLTKYGIREWLGAGIIAAILLAGNIYVTIWMRQPTGWGVSAFIILAWLAIAAFFRNPSRKVPDSPEVLVSPADGVIKDIELVKPPEGTTCFDGKDVLRVGIFLSVLDVHLNRAPCLFEVEQVLYKQGVFHDARDIEAITENESMTLAGVAEVRDMHFPMAVRQISGKIARRIVCPVNIGRVIDKGEIYGMIKFGSRTEVYLPAIQDIKLAVKVGDRVLAGSSIIAKLSSADSNSTKKWKISPSAKTVVLDEEA